MNDLQIFENEEFGKIRVIEYSDEVWFVGTDVALALGYSNPRDALAKHVDEEDKNTVAIRDGNRGNPNVTIINESGMYSLIFGSVLDSAKQFKRWITRDVIPSIRKHGYYHVFDSTADLIAAIAANMTDEEKRKNIIMPALRANAASSVDFINEFSAGRVKMLPAQREELRKLDKSYSELPDTVKRWEFRKEGHYTIADVPRWVIEHRRPEEQDDIENALNRLAKKDEHHHDFCMAVDGVHFNEYGYCQTINYLYRNHYIGDAVLESWLTESSLTDIYQYYKGTY